MKFAAEAIYSLIRDEKYSSLELKGQFFVGTIYLLPQEKEALLPYLIKINEISKKICTNVPERAEYYAVMHISAFINLRKTIKQPSLQASNKRRDIDTQHEIIFKKVKAVDEAASGLMMLSKQTSAWVDKEKSKSNSNNINPKL